MLSLGNRIAFLLFAVVTGGLGLHGFLRFLRRIRRGAEDTDARWNEMPRRLWYALTTTLLQNRTFRKRPWVSFFHSFIFYGFVFYLLVNLVDAVDGFVPLRIPAQSGWGGAYLLLADVLSALVLVGVVALVLRRFLLPSRRDFRFNERTLLHPRLKEGAVAWDSVLVSGFILFHVGSRAVGAGAKLAAEGPSRWQPFATLLSHLFTPAHAEAWRVFGYWGALGSVLLFLMYFPRTKHVHIFMSSVKYVVARDVPSGVLPAVVLDVDAEAPDAPKLGAEKLEDLAWPRLLDAYACVQCNRCQDVCPATATGKSLSPSALEINKRMELNELARTMPGWEYGGASPKPLLQFALSAEAAWACTTCGACLQACPVQDEPMLDIIDVRREQVMMAGEFPAQLQTAFRGMERAKNPWGINHEKRTDWAAGLHVKTTAENPEPEVLYWVGCAASYDPQAQKTARAFVQLLNHAGVDFAVLGKRECCTGDSARRAGNEYLYRQLADANVATLNEVKPKLVVATCPHCLNAVGKEYRQIGGDFRVMHHTEYLQGLVAEGKLPAESGSAAVTYHDPCYLGRHNGVYDAPRNLLHVISNDVVELPRRRENAFCCGAGGAQFWKEEEPGDGRISDNRYAEVKRTLESASGTEEKVLAVGCPFCKSMLESTPAKDGDAIAVRDVAELLWEGVQRRAGIGAVVDEPAVAQAVPLPMLGTMSTAASSVDKASEEAAPVEKAREPPSPVEASAAALLPPEPAGVRKKWSPKSAVKSEDAQPAEMAPVEVPPEASPQPKKWTPKSPPAHADTAECTENAPALDTPPEPAVQRKKWSPKSAASAEGNASSSTEELPSGDAAAGTVTQPVGARKKWVPKG